MKDDAMLEYDNDECPDQRPEVCPPSKAATPRQEIKREVIELAKMVVLFLIMFGLLKTFVVEGYEVQGPSMIPTLMDRQRILVFKLPHHLSKLPLLHRFSAIGEQDIIVFQSRGDSNKRYIKRVIAKGPNRPRGKVVDARRRDDTQPSAYSVKVEFNHGDVYVNNLLREEDYLVPEEKRSPDAREPVYLEGNQYYVLGDHRSMSKDSRSFGAIDEEQIIGRAVLRFWPLSEFGLL